MKKLVVLSLALMVFFVATASAVILQSANSTAQGKWAISVIACQENEISGGTLGTLSSLSYGPVITYGITDQLSVSGLYVPGSYSGGLLGSAAAGNPKMTTGAYSAGLNYCIMDETKGTPVSVKAAGYYTGANLDTEIAGATTKTAITVTDGSLIVSKLIIPFIPYAGLKYAMQNSGGTDSTITEIVLGSGLFFSPQFGVLAEYVVKNTTTGGASADTKQIGLSLVCLL